MPTMASDVLVVGGGIVGTSAAYNLALRRAGRIVLLDKDGIAAHASSLSAGLTRNHYSNEAEARVALAGQRWWSNWTELVGTESPFHRSGTLNLVSREDHDRLRANVEMLRGIGVDTFLVGPEEIVEIEPALNVAEDELAAYEPATGWSDPGAATRGMAAAARREGVEIREGVTVTEVTTASGRVTGVETTAGHFPAAVVVLACGAWAVPLAARLGLRLPVRNIGIQLPFYARPRALSRGREGFPVLLDRAHGTYLRPDGTDSCLTGLMSYEVELTRPEDHLTMARDLDHEAMVEAQITRRLPAFAGAVFQRTRSGPLDFTPDLCAIVEACADPSGLFLATGMSGSGFKKGPAFGACLAEMIVDGRATTAPVEPFRLGRFAERRPIESNGYAVAPQFRAAIGHSMVH